MASGRLGSAKLQPYQAALVYSNTSGSPASVNVQATVLDSTHDSSLALAVDTATVSVNQTTTSTSIPSGSVTNAMFWLDPLSNTTPIKFDYTTPSSYSNSGDFPVSYWNGSAWYKPTTGWYGSEQNQKVDPYFLINPSSYGKTKASLPLKYGTASSSAVWRTYDDLNTFTGAQFAAALQNRTTGLSSYSYSRSSSYSNHGGSNDLYSYYVMNCRADSGMEVFDTKTGQAITYSTSNSLIYQYVGANYIDGFTHYWYAPRIMGSNGLFLIQTTGYTGSSFVIADVDLAISLGSINKTLGWTSTASNATWWALGWSSGDFHVGWFEYNPNTDRYYLEYINPNDSANHGIYSVSRADLRALASRGTAKTYSRTDSLAFGFRFEGKPAWRSIPSNVMRPLRINESLWWTADAAGNAYTSSDLSTWTAATTSLPTLGYPNGATIVTPVSDTSFLYASSGVADVSEFDSGYTGVSDTAVLEYNTSINNYQRTGLVLNNGDKLYAQNYGSYPISITAMGYEGE